MEMRCIIALFSPLG